MRYLVTAGAGFVGSHLVDALTGRGDSVVVLDDLSTDGARTSGHVVESALVRLVKGSDSNAE